jgi:uncharacterized protein (TIGR03663 family)
MSDDGVSPDEAGESTDGSATDPEEPTVGGSRGSGRPGDRLDAWANRLAVSPRGMRAVLVLAAVGLVARLLWLGSRPAHFDEGRVAYWTLRYADSGQFAYRYIIHGPLVQHVDRWLFALAGPSDAVMRLPVALVGAALPLVALWFRDHLDDAEVVGMAALLALNPILLYYSRFLRSDLLVATFMLASLGALLRLHATRRPRYLYAAAVLAALGLGSKENAVIYGLCWLGAAGLLVETELFRPRGHRTGVALLTDRARDARAAVARGDGLLAPGAKRAGGHLFGAIVVFVLVVFSLFAPRAGSGAGPGLWRTVGDPAQLPALLRATAWDLASGFGYWFGGAAEAGCRKETLAEGYACYLWRMAVTVGLFAPATTLLAAVGFLRERYAVADSRPLVSFAAFWGVASFVGYPLGTDIWAAWVVTHVVVPLSIPAGAGAGLLVRTARRGIADDRGLLVVLPTVTLVALAAVTAGMAVQTSSVDATSRDHPADMVQYAQPQQELRPATEAMRTAVTGHEGGPDVVYYGHRYNVSNESADEQPPVPEADAAWFNRLPLPWYTEGMDADTASTGRADVLASLLGDRPPVVVASERAADDVRGRVAGYRTFAFDLRAPVDGPGRYTSVVVFVNERRLAGDGDARQAPGVAGVAGAPPASHRGHQRASHRGHQRASHRGHQRASHRE